MLGLDLAIVVRAAEALAPSVGVTVGLTAAALIVCLTVGLLLAIGALSNKPVPRRIAGAYSLVSRNVPYVILVYLAYFGLPSIGVSIHPLAAGIATLGLMGAGYFCEICRAAIMSVPQAQVNAALALGLDHWQIRRLVILPQALVLMTPATAGLAISLLKESSVLSVIAVGEVSYRSQSLASETFAFPEVLIVTAATYWVMSEAIVKVGRHVERRLARWTGHAV
jgi:His/Glu/Gln/Arg/opine family amino acid ABC transporter permease subunit